MTNKKPRTLKQISGQHPQQLKQPDYNRFITRLITIINIGGKMSEQGADKAGFEISTGFRFFLKACGIGIALALFLWKSPDFLNALAEFIVAIK